MAAVLIAELPGLGHLNGHEIAALAGVSPLNRRGQSTVFGGGRVSVHTILYMVTVTAIRHNPAIREFYAHLY